MEKDVNKFVGTLDPDFWQVAETYKAQQCDENSPAYCRPQQGLFRHQ